MSHPLLVATAALEAALDSVAGCDPAWLDRADKAAALVELVRLEARLGELRLRVMAAAGDVAEETAARDVADWLAQHTRVRPEEARADLALATALDRRRPHLAAALRGGAATLDQARVVARALDELPRDVGAEVVKLAEQTLVGYCADFGPRQLTRLGRRILAVIAPEIGEAAEARRLTEMEAEAHRRTRLTLHACGDGTTRITGLVPDATAHRLATYLEAFTSPRQDHDGEHRVEADGRRTPYPRRLGDAFCQLLETLDPTRLPLHGGDATTVVVTIPLQTLREELGTADVIGADDQITAAGARRLACTAGIVPAVLGGKSEVLDLGRRQRLHSTGQRRAMALRDRRCRAEGCTIPANWCEAHHLTLWSRGGPTSVADGVLLCSHHHHRIHDPAYRSSRLPDGDLRFHRRE